MDRRPIWIALLVFLPFLVVGNIVFSGELIGPTEAIGTMYPHGDVLKVPPDWDILQADGVLQFDVWRKLVFESWRSGHVPFWNPYQFGGTPLLANSQSAALYPPHILAAFLPFPQAIALLAWFHLALAALGIRALCLRLGASEPGAAFAAAVFALSPFMVSWTVLPSVITTCAYIPWILAHLIGIFQKQKWSGPLFGLCIGLMLLGGHLQFAFYGLIAVIVAGTWLTVTYSRAAKKIVWPQIFIAKAGAILGILLCLVQLLPVLSYSQFSHRKTTATAEGYTAYVANALKPWELVGVVAPGFFGQPGHIEFVDQSSQYVPRYWPQFVKPGANYAESAVTLGPAVLFGLFLIRRKLNWKDAGGIAIVGVLGLLLALGTGLDALLYFGIPGFAATGSPGRAVVLFVLAGCVLAGLALSPVKLSEEAEDPPKPDTKQKLLQAAPLIGLVIVCLLTIVAASSLQSLPSWIPNFSVTSLASQRLIETAPWLLLSLLLCAAAWYVFKKGRDSIPAVGLLFFAQLAIAQLGIIPSGHLPQSPDLPAPAPLQRYAFVNGPWSFMQAAPALMPPNLASYYGINDIAGYDSLIHRDTVAMLNKIDGGEDPAPPINGNIMFVKKSFDLDALKEAGVTKIYSRQPFEDPNLFWQPKDGYYVADTNGPGILSAPGESKLDSYRAGEAVFQASGPGNFIFRERSLPGWTATIDGKPAELKDGDWLSIDLPVGEHKVTFTYVAPGYSLGLILSAFGLINLVIWSLFIRRAPNASDLPKEAIE